MDLLAYFPELTPSNPIWLFVLYQDLHSYFLGAFPPFLGALKSKITLTCSYHFRQHLHDLLSHTHSTLLDIWHRHGTRHRCRVLRHQAARRLNLVKLQRQAPKILSNSGA
jgi:hypothetical protein